MKQKDVIPADTGWTDKKVIEFPGSPFLRIGRDWMLITAAAPAAAAAAVQKDKNSWNTMTASWGGLGVLWGKYVAFIFIRPSRHTFEFANKTGLFTLSFFDESKKEALNICGKVSGRDTDKAAAAGLTPIVFSDEPFSGAVSFMEAKEILICRKLYQHDIDPAKFLDASIENHYNGKDYHRMFVSEIIGYKTRS